ERFGLQSLKWIQRRRHKVVVRYAGTSAGATWTTSSCAKNGPSRTSESGSAGKLDTGVRHHRATRPVVADATSKLKRATPSARIRSQRQGAQVFRILDHRNGAGADGDGCQI